MGTDDIQEEVKRLRQQRNVLAGFGGRALSTNDLQHLLQEAVELVSQAIDVKLVKVLELLPGGEEVLVRAGVNWKPGVVGQATIPAHSGSPAGYAIETGEPVISRDVATERRFEIPNLLKEHGVRSMVNVVISGERGAWGVLEVDSPRSREFDTDDASFLQNYANLLAGAIDRLQVHEELNRTLETRNILMHELQHRVSNLLGNIRALSQRIARRSASVEDFVQAFDERLGVLARTQEMLTGRGEAIMLENVLRQELEAHGVRPGPKVVATGPDLVLAPVAAQALAMAFHELATNAVKYGALREEAGHIAVAWQVGHAPSGGEEIAIRWRETGVEIGQAPARKGYGSEVIEKGLPYMLGGSAKLLFHPDGLECVVRFPAPAQS